MKHISFNLKNKQPSDAGYSVCTLPLNFKSHYLVFLLVFILIIPGYSQVKEDKSPFNVNLNLRNMHVWHGLIVHPGAMLATSVEYNSPNKKFLFGFWGGSSFSPRDVQHNSGGYVSAFYREMSLYTKYNLTDRLFIEAVSHNNYTGVEERGDVLHYFRYDKKQGYNFVDLNWGFQATKRLSFYLATILAGRSGDYKAMEDGDLKDSYTHYLEVTYRIWDRSDFSMNLVAGGAYSFLTDKTFYTTGRSNIVQVALNCTKTISIGDYTLPVGVNLITNPEKEFAVLQVDIKVF